MIADDTESDAEDLAWRAARKRRTRRLQLVAAVVFSIIVLARTGPALVEILRGAST